MIKVAYKTPPVHELRKFGIVMFCAFLVLSCFVTAIGYWLHGAIGWKKIYVLNGIGIIIFLLPGLVFPSVLAPVHKYWMKFGLLLGLINSKIILTLIWVLVFTPVALIQKIIRRDSMEKKLLKDADTYWVDRSKEKPNPAHFKRQF